MSGGRVDLPPAASPVMLASARRLKVPRRSDLLDKAELQVTPEKQTNPTSTGVRAFFRTKAFRYGLAIVLVVLVSILLAREIHPAEILTAIRQANVWWIVAAAVVAALSWAGAAVPFKALASLRIPFADATLVQVASSFVGVAAPAGLGPVALHIDYLKRRGMDTAPAVAIVAFIEIAQVVTSVSMLGVALLFDHDFPHMNFPLKKILIVVGIVVVLLAFTLLFPRVRALAAKWIQRNWLKVKPEVDRLRHHPLGIVWALGGVFIQTFTYALALVFSMYAVGHPITVAMGVTIYLIGNTIGSAVPVPGGIGSTLAATVGALHLMGVPTALAASGVVLFRLTSFYLQVPVGALAFTYMQRKKLL